MQWTTGAYSDESNRGRYTAYLTHGIPETDAVQFTASCVAGTSADVAPAVLGYNTGKLREGAKVNVLFFADGRQIYQKPGRVHGRALEEGVSGVLWLDYAGRPVDYAGLNPGEAYTQQTFVGHPWMFTDGPGNCKEIYVPRAGDTRFDITAE